MSSGGSGGSGGSGLKEAATRLAQRADLGPQTIDRYRTLLGFDRDDNWRLRRLHEPLGDEWPRLIEEFYRHLLSFERLRWMLEEEGQLERLHTAQERHFASLTIGPYDESYLLRRLAVGIVHQRIALEPEWYLSSYGKVLCELLPTVWRISGGEVASLQALVRVVFLDFCLSLEAYQLSGQRSLTAGRGGLAEVPAAPGQEQGVLRRELLPAGRRRPAQPRLTSAAEVADSMGIDQREVRLRCRALDLGPDDGRRLVDLLPIMRRHSLELADSLIAHMDAAAHGELTANLTATAARRELAEYLETHFEGDYGREYVLDRLARGLRNQRLDLTLPLQLGAWCRHLTTLIGALRRWMEGEDDAKYLATVNSLLKVVLFDIGLTLDTFLYADLQELAELVGEAEALTSSVPWGQAVISDHLRVVSANPSFARLFDLPAAEVAGRRLADLVPGGPLSEAVRRAMTTGEGPENLVVELPGDGRMRLLRAGISRLEARTGEVSEDSRLVLLIVEDLSLLDQLKASASTADLRFRNLVEGIDGVVYEAELATDSPDGGWRFSYVSDHAEALIGHPLARWTGDGEEPWHQLIVAEDRRRFLASRARAQTSDERQELEYRLRSACGAVVWVRDSCRPVPGPDGGLRLLGMLVDITRRKQLEEQLSLAHRLEAMGSLAAGLAHDFRNLMMVISCHGELLEEAVGEGSPLQGNISEIQGAVERAAGLTRQLSAFARRQVLNPQSVLIDELLQSLTDRLSQLLPPAVRTVLEFEVSGEWVLVDRVRLDQLLVDLIENARDAMQGEGTLTVRAVVRELDDREADHRGVVPGQYLELTVADDGSGMERETAERVFEPFFTTKGPDRGRGLGLSTAYGVARQSGGDLWLEATVPGAGTTFRLCVPLVAD